MVCSWYNTSITEAVLLSQGTQESTDLQNYINCPPEIVSASRNDIRCHDNNHKATKTEETSHLLFLFSSSHLFQRFNRSLMRNFGVVRSDTLCEHPYNHYCHLHNITSRSFSSTVNSDTARESSNTLNHLNRYHHQFPLDLQGWPRRWTQTVLFPHISAVI